MSNADGPTSELAKTKASVAAHLMGIRDTEHLSIHSARGALFENLVISELLKRRYNQGLAANLYFWRNNTGDEVDLVLEQGDKLLPIEIRSGQTFNSDFLTGLNKWVRYAGDAAMPAHLVYGGDTQMTRSGVAVHGWQDLRNLPGG
jgi:predicted AAA+ superfamily ATPase